MPNPTYAIIGTGAVGGLYGAKLQQSGCEVHFLLNRDYEAVKSNGLRLESVWGDLHLTQVNAYDRPEAMPRCDVAIVALKSTQNHLLPQLLPPIVKPHGIVLLLQNGIGIEPLLQDLLPQCQIIGGICFLCSNKVGPGQIRHLDYGQITLGAYRRDPQTQNPQNPAQAYQAGGITAEIEALTASFEAAGVPIQRSEDLMLIRWQKLVWNIPFNGLSVVLNAATAELMAAAVTRELARCLMEEVAQGAAAYDREIPSTFIEQMLASTAKMEPYLTSMKLDYDHHRPLELEAMFQNPLALAQAKGLDLPCIRSLYQQLQFLADRRQP
ncbi:MAG: putative 2-dehydropantoate 2-reductase [Prochlorothrix sp.]